MSASRAQPLARRYADRVAVRCRDGVPVEFDWRGRCHVVDTVYDHWTRTGAWWTSAKQPGALSPVGVPDDEWEHWRVDATGVGCRRSVVVELAMAGATATWTVTAVAD